MRDEFAAPTPDVILAHATTDQGTASGAPHNSNHFRDGV